MTNKIFLIESYRAENLVMKVDNLRMGLNGIEGKGETKINIKDDTRHLKPETGA